MVDSLSVVKSWILLKKNPSYVRGIFHSATSVPRFDSFDSLKKRHTK